METNERTGLYGSRNLRSLRVSKNRSVARRSPVEALRARLTLPTLTIPKGAGKKVVKTLAVATLIVAVVMVSSTALATLLKEKSVPADVQAPPRTPFFIVGYTRDSGGAILGGCAVNITDVTTGEWNNTTVSNAVTGFYSCDVNNGLASGVAGSQVINVVATKTGLEGTNTSSLPAVLGAFYQIDVKLFAVVIPEFPTLMVPMVGLLGVVVAVSFVTRRSKK